MSTFDFDPTKNRTNLQKHGIGLAVGALIWNDYVFEREDDRRNYGETRFIALGSVDGRVLLVVYTLRGEKRRLISARKANEHERQIYRSARARIEASEAGKKED
jgi:uncharacterized DUF497 family protein